MATSRGWKKGRPRKFSTANPHGTNSGYVTHIVAGEPACDACKKGHAEYMQSWRKGK